MEAIMPIDRFAAIRRKAILYVEEFNAQVY